MTSPLRGWVPWEPVIPRLGLLRATGWLPVSANLIRREAKCRARCRLHRDPMTTHALNGE